MKLLRCLCLLSIVASALPAIAIPITNTVIVEGNEWAQWADFTMLSWNDINTVCPGGVCGDGTLNDFDMGGWTWADNAGVAMLFSAYIDAVGGSNPELDSAWAANFFADFTPIEDVNGFFGAGGHTSTRTPFGQLGVAVMLYGSRSGPGIFDSTFIFTTHRGDDVSSTRGGWFTRTAPPSTVPIPDTLFLLGLGLFGVRWSQKRAA